jgi:hypothetical protein
MSLHILTIPKIFRFQNFFFINPKIARKSSYRITLANDPIFVIRFGRILGKDTKDLKPKRTMLILYALEVF